MKTIRIVLACAALAAGNAMAQKSCGAADSQAAEKALDRVVNWDGMYKAFKDHAHCDNAMTEDTFTDALMRLAVQWKDVDQFAKRWNEDPQYKEFVKKHLTSLTAREDAKSVYSRTKGNCPPKLEAFCAELSEVVKP